MKKKVTPVTLCQRLEPWNVELRQPRYGAIRHPAQLLWSWICPPSSTNNHLVLTDVIICVSGAKRLQQSGLNLPSDQRVWCRLGVFFLFVLLQLQPELCKSGREAERKSCVFLPWLHKHSQIPQNTSRLFPFLRKSHTRFWKNRR